MYLDYENQEKGYKKFELTKENIRANVGKQICYVDKRTIDSNEEAIRQLQNDIYKVAQIYFECVGEHEGYLIGNGHHMAQELCEKAKEIWISRQNAR